MVNFFVYFLIIDFNSSLWATMDKIRWTTPHDMRTLAGVTIGRKTCSWRANVRGDHADWLFTPHIYCSGKIRAPYLWESEPKQFINDRHRSRHRFTDRYRSLLDPQVADTATSTKICGAKVGFEVRTLYRIARIGHVLNVGTAV